MQTAGASGLSAELVSACVLPSAQQFSIVGHWAQLPAVKVSVHSGDFTSSEVSAIQAAGLTWNALFDSVHGKDLYELGATGTGNVSSTVQTSPSCGSGTISDGAVLYKRYSGWSHSSAAIAVTTTCPTPSGNGGLPTIYNAIMEFNYVNFFITQSNQFPDLQSVALHEMGHLLGLDHSCGPLGAPNQNEPNAACPSPPYIAGQMTDPLFTTVMFPFFIFDPTTHQGNVQQILSTNDEGRANCAYENVQ